MIIIPPHHKTVYVVVPRGDDPDWLFETFYYHYPARKITKRQINFIPVDDGQEGEPIVFNVLVLEVI